MSHYRVGQMKSPSLRKCRNPTCDNYYYGYKDQKYCCSKCANQATNQRRKDRMASDPVYRQKCIELGKISDEKYREKRRKRLMNDPEFHRKVLERQREYYKKRKDKKDKK